MNKLAFTVLFLGLISCFQNETKNKIEYYAKLAGIISPNLEYLGRGKISEEEAKSLKHYQFNYDEEGFLSSIQFFDKNQPSDNSYYGTHQVIYTRFEDQLIRSYFNTKGQKATVYRHYYLGDNIHQEVFHLDNTQNKILLILKDSIDNQIESGIGTYQFKFQKIDDKTFIQSQFKKDGSPNILTPYFPFNQAKISTGKNSFLHTIINVDSEGKPILNVKAGYAQIIFDFDDYGNELGWSFHDISNSLSNRKACFDMDYGFAKVVYEFDWENKKLGLHNGFNESYFDEHNLPTDNNKNIHRVMYEYDEKGNFSRMVKYSLEGREVK